MQWNKNKMRYLHSLAKLNRLLPIDHIPIDLYTIPAGAVIQAQHRMPIQTPAQPYWISFPKFLFLLIGSIFIEAPQVKT